MLYFNLKPDYITVLLQNNLARLQLFVIILNCIGISYRSQYALDVSAVLFNVKLITLPLWSIYKVVCYSMQTTTTGLICLRKVESEVLFSPISY